MSPLRCPDCDLPLQDRACVVAGRAVSLSGCTCGGAWFSLPQLEQVLGGEVALEPLSAQTARRCPTCTLSLTPVLLPGVIPVETCSACRGVWLDWPDVLDLRLPGLEAVLQPAPAQRYAGLYAPDAPAAAAQGGFCCAKCQARTPFAGGHASARGLVCGACVPQVQPQPHVPGFLQPGTSASDPAGSLDVVDLTDAVFGD